MKVYDAFNFFNELDLLEIRLNELDDFVDKFVIVECAVTHQNNPKELFFENNKDQFKRWADRIIHVVVKDTPDTQTTHIVEEHQFNAARRGLMDVRDDDLVLWSCLDEIPKKSTVKYWMGSNPNPIMLMQFSVTGFLNCYQKRKGADWAGGRMLKGSHWKSTDNPYVKFRDLYLQHQVLDGGWHFTYQGGPDQINTKLKSFGHREWNIPSIVEGNFAENYCNVRKALKDGSDTFDIMPWDILPPFIYEQRERFKDFLLPQ